MEFSCKKDGAEQKRFDEKHDFEHNHRKSKFILSLYVDNKL